MTLTDFFLAVNAAGVRLANVGGQLQLRGRPGAVTPELRAGALEHKVTVLALLPPASAPEASGVTAPSALGHADDNARERVEFPDEHREAEQERAAVTAEGEGEVAPSETERCCQEWDHLVSGGAFRHDHDWRDWRLEWLLEVGKLHLRMRSCRDAEALARLRPLADATPTTLAEWLALGAQIVDAEHQLRRLGKLPPHPWPERGER